MPSARWRVETSPVMPVSCSPLKNPLSKKALLALCVAYLALTNRATYRWGIGCSPLAAHRPSPRSPPMTRNPYPSTQNPKHINHIHSTDHGHREIMMLPSSCKSHFYRCKFTTHQQVHVKTRSGLSESQVISKLLVFRVCLLLCVRSALLAPSSGPLSRQEKVCKGWNGRN